MRIDLNAVNINGVPQDDKTRKASGSQGANSGSRPEDKTSLSPESISIASLEAAAMAHPEVRHDRVARLALAIQNGEYKPDSKETAAAMIQQHKR